MTSEMLFQSTGRRAGALLLSVMRNGLFMIPTLVILEKWRGMAGIQEAYSLACVLSFIPSVLLAVRFFRNLPKDTVDGCT